MSQSKNSILAAIQATFKYVGIKKFTKTDKSKQAYVPNKEQRKVLENAGIKPGTLKEGIDPFYLHVLVSGEKIEANYYLSIRENPGRKPEARMGLFIKHRFFEVGDDLCLATDGKQVFVYKVSDDDVGKVDKKHEEKIQKILEQVDPKYLLEKARSAPKKPETEEVTTKRLKRSDHVAAVVKQMADFKCEVDTCSYQGFEKSDGDQYIEIHHLDQLSDGGEDSIDNAVAVCPNCHRMLHFGKNKKKLKDNLKRKVPTRNKNYVQRIFND